MYSHGSSARVGVGKSGHGGRNYRPPRPRRDPNATPPPLKECACLLQIDLQEYAAKSPRVHLAFGGREALQRLESQLRSHCLVHLVVPGRKQAGPIAIVGKTYQEALPAAAWLLSRLQLEEEGTTTLEGRMQRNVKNPQDVAIAGRWHYLRTTQDSLSDDSSSRHNIQPYWLFQSESLSVMVCPLSLAMDDFYEDEDGTSESVNIEATTDNIRNEDKNDDTPYPLMVTLKTCVDNVIFRLGNLNGLDVFVQDYPPMALCAGIPQDARILYEEVTRAFLLQSVDPP
jgi:hypothetical protein